VSSRVASSSVQSIAQVAKATNRRDRRAKVALETQIGEQETVAHQ